MARRRYREPDWPYLALGLGFILVAGWYGNPALRPTIVVLGASVVLLGTIWIGIRISKGVRRRSLVPTEASIFSKPDAFPVAAYVGSKAVQAAPRLKFNRELL
jgi:hypothetical protein